MENLAIVVHLDAERLFVGQRSETQESNVEGGFGAVFINQQKVLIQPHHHLHQRQRRTRWCRHHHLHQITPYMVVQTSPPAPHNTVHGGAGITTCTRQHRTWWCRHHHLHQITSYMLAQT